MSNFSKRALRWAAPVALVGALGLAACGDSDDTEAVRVAAPSVAGLGSDQHLNNQAEELARASAGAGSDQHLNNQAAELARQQRSYQAASARLTAQAEQYERSVEASNRAAQMAQADAYVDSLEARAADADFSGGSYRAAQKAQADAYVDSLEARAEDSGTDDEFVPGSRHMPTR
jgi:hypothetical protein